MDPQLQELGLYHHRHNDIFKVNKGYSKRYMQSAIPSSSMQRILNRDFRSGKGQVKVRVR